MAEKRATVSEPLGDMVTLEPASSGKRRRFAPKPAKSDVGRRLKSYKRGDSLDTSGLDDKKLKGHLKKRQRQSHQAAFKSAMAEILLPSEAGFLEAEGIEKTFKFKQADIKAAVDISAATKVSTGSSLEAGQKAPRR